MKYETFYLKFAHHPYGVNFVSTFKNTTDIGRWCLEQFGSDVSFGIFSFTFRYEADRTWFLLRWS